MVAAGIALLAFGMLALTLAAALPPVSTYGGFEASGFATAATVLGVVSSLAGLLCAAFGAYTMASAIDRLAAKLLDSPPGPDRS
jgi:hypothetical protein